MDRPPYFAMFRMRGAVMSLLALTGCTTNIGHVMSRYDYVEITPPSQLAYPGTVIRERQAKPLRYRRICSHVEAFGSDVTPEISTTAEVLEKLTRRFQLGSEYLDTLGIHLSASAFSEASVQLRNLEIHDVSVATAIDHFKHRLPQCDEALELYAKDRISMITGVLVGDATYSFRSESTVTLQAVDNALKTTPWLQVVASDVKSRTITGERLTWGVQTNSRIVGRQQLLRTTKRARFDPDEDEHLRRRILELFHRSPSLQTKDVAIETLNDIVLLSGHTESAAQKRAIERTAQEVPGVRHVASDALQVWPTSANAQQVHPSPPPP